MASIYKRGKVWYIKYYVKGKRYRVSTNSSDRSYAMGKAAEIEKAKHELPTQPQKIVLVSELLDDLQLDYKMNERRSAPNLEYKLNKHVRPYFGNLPHDIVTVGTIIEYKKYRHFNGKASNRTVNRELAALKRAYNLGVENGRISYMPKIKMLKEPSGRTDYWELHEVSTILYELPEWARRVVLFAVLTGWRKSEVFDLRWTNIYFPDNEIRIRKTKNDQVRVYEMIPQIKQMLAEIPQTSEWVFTWDGIHNVRWAFRTAWEKALDKAGYKGRTFHAFRRTARQIMDRLGVGERVSMALLGHKTRYIHDQYRVVAKSDLVDAADKLGHSEWATLTELLKAKKTDSDE